MATKSNFRPSAARPGRLYCRLTMQELADLVLTAVPDARLLFPRPLYGCPM